MDWTGIPRGGILLLLSCNLSRYLLARRRSTRTLFLFLSSTGPGTPSPLARTGSRDQTKPWRRLLHESLRCAPLRARCAPSPLPAAPCVSAPRKKRQRRRRRPGPSPRSTRRRPRPSSEAPPEDCSPRRPRRSSTSSPGKGTSRSNMHARTRAPYPGFCLIRTKRTREPLRLGREHLPR